MAIASFLTTSGGSPLKLMCVGDSITTGVDASVYYGPEDGFRYRLWYKLRALGNAVEMVGPNTDGGVYAAWNSNHAGVSGTTLAVIDTAVAAWISTYDPDIIVLLGGVNDLVTQTVATTKARLESVLDTINGAKGVGCEVFVSSITINSSDATDCANFNAEIPGVCTAKSVQYVDAGSSLTSASGLLSDNVHPNSKGYETMAATLATAIDGVLNP